jgi:hypothetical protein
LRGIDATRIFLYVERSRRATRDLDGAGIERSALEKFKLALIAKGFDEDEIAELME